MSECSSYRLDQILNKQVKYLYVNKIRDDGIISLDFIRCGGGDFFYADDFEPYKEEPKLNYIEQVSKMLGVEVGEKFNGFGKGGMEFRENYFSEDGYHGNVNNLVGLIEGRYTIEKITPYTNPIKCHKGDKFKYVRSDGEIQAEQWDGGTFSCAMSLIGNMFADDAVIPQAQIDEMVKKLKGDEV